MVSFWIHYDIFIRLLESEHQIHHLQLSLHDDGGVGQDRGGRMTLVEDAMFVLGDVDGSEQVVLG